jgi:hypothetical protein
MLRSVLLKRVYRPVIRERRGLDKGRYKEGLFRLCTRDTKGIATGARPYRAVEILPYIHEWYFPYGAVFFWTNFSMIS